MFYALLSQHNEIYDADAEGQHLHEKPTEEVAAEVNQLLKRRLSQIMDKKKQIEVLKTKIRAVGRMARLWGI